MSMTTGVTVHNLQISHRSFTIKLRVLRVGSQQKCGNKFSTRVQKLIMVDEESVHIGVIPFNDEIDRFSERLNLNKTYLITNADVRAVNHMFPNAHHQKELVLKKHSVIKETNEDIGLHIHFKFVSFSAIDPDQTRTTGVDVLGVVIKVREWKKLTNSKIASRQLREITIINKDKKRGRGTANFGQAISSYRDIKGELQLQTTMASILQINPTCAEMEDMRQWLCANNDPKKLGALAVSRRMQATREVTIQQIIHQRQSLTEDRCYCFKAVIDSIDNISSIWYDSCKRCTASLFQSPNSTSCNKCNEDIEAPMPRYRLVINVVNGDDRAVVSLFEDAVATFVGCQIEEYITSLEKGEQNSKYFCALSSQVSKECRFLIFLNSKAQLRNEKLVVVAEGVELIAPVMLGNKEGASTMTREVQPKSIEQSLEGGAVETLKNGCPKDKRQGKHGSNLKLKNPPNTKKRKGANISVQLSSDDEEPLKNLKQKCTKKTENGIRKRRSTAIKIKREKD